MYSKEALLMVLLTLSVMSFFSCGAHTTLPPHLDEELSCGADAVINSMAASEPLPAAEIRPLKDGNITFDMFIGPFAKLRIGVFTEDLNDPRKFCSVAGDVRPDFKGSKITCAETNILTPEKRKILIEYLLPRAVEMHQERLRVQRVSGSIVVPTYTGGFCGEFIVPESHKTDGVMGYDFLLYVGASRVEGASAWAGTCSRGEFGRPLIGMTCIDPGSVSESDYIVRLVAHEIGHALGFSQSVFLPDKMTETMSWRGKPAAHSIVTRNVLNAGREFFGWNELPGVELEDQTGSATSHWKQRNLRDDMMAGVLGAGKYSALTLAAFEDMGYYKADFSKAEPMVWGYKMGEAMLTEKCIVNGEAQNPFFCSNTSRRYCSYNLLEFATCGVSTWSSDLPSHFQYFTDPRIGGGSAMMDYCPSVSSSSSLSCLKGNLNSMPGSVLGENSRCFNSVTPIATVDGDAADAICAEVSCDYKKKLYSVKPKGAKKFTQCPTWKSIELATSTETFKSGSVQCLPFEMVCTNHALSSFLSTSAIQKLFTLLLFALTLLATL